MDPLKPITENNINIQDEKRQERKITKEQEQILFQLHLANILLFGGGRLSPEQKKEQENLQEKYLKGLKPGDKVNIGLEGVMGGGEGTIISNDGEIVKVEAKCYLNKKKKQGIRSFSTKNGFSKSFIIEDNDREDKRNKRRFYIEIPDEYTVKPTSGIPQEALKEIEEIYNQAGDPKTCYDLVNALKIKDE